MSQLLPSSRRCVLLLLAAAPFAARAQAGGGGIGTTAPDRPRPMQAPAGTTELMSLKNNVGATATTTRP